MIMQNICLTYLVEYSETEDFKDALLTIDGVADWECDPDYVDYTPERTAHTCNLFDVYFDDIDDAQRFDVIIQKAF